MMQIDLNADQSFGRWTLGDGDALLEVITSANVACPTFSPANNGSAHILVTASRAELAWMVRSVR